MIKANATANNIVKKLMNSARIYFGPHLIPPQHIFYHSTYSVGIVNLKPLLLGHVLILPVRKVSKFVDLNKEELNDLFESTQKVARAFEAHYHDGVNAGQTVPHVHVHLLPRRVGDFKHNDEIYDRLEEKKGLGHIDDERIPRAFEEMASEASELAALFNHD